MLEHPRAIVRFDDCWNETGVSILDYRGCRA